MKISSFERMDKQKESIQTKKQFSRNRDYFEIHTLS